MQAMLYLSAASLLVQLSTVWGLLTVQLITVFKMKKDMKEAGDNKKHQKPGGWVQSAMFLFNRNNRRFWR